MESHKKRYAGPDVPINKGIQRHAFGANEHPLIFQTLARAVQLQQQDKTRHTKTTVSSTATTTATATTTPTLQRPTLGTGNQFAGLAVAAAMKNRFTTMTEETGAAPTPVGLHHMLPPKPVGLHMPPQSPRVDVDVNVDVESKPPPKKEEEKEKQQNKPIVLERTAQPFSPHPLVCKRFGVQAPSNSIGSSVQHQPGRLTEAAYFEKEVLPARNKNQSLSSSLSLLEQQQPSRNAKNDDIPDDETEQEPTGLERPPMEKLKSIFEPPSEEDDSSDADTDLDSVDENRKKDDGQTKDVADSQKMVVHEQTNNDDDDEDKVNNTEESQMVKYDSSSSDDSSSRRRRRHHHRKERRRKKHRRHRKRSRSPDKSSDSTDDRRKKERRRKQEKKRRKKSSHRKRDKESS
jgi:hypothetical protein